MLHAVRVFLRISSSLRSRQVIVDHEVREFAGDTLFRRLIRDKWERFGRRMHLARAVAPYVAILAAALAAAALRGAQVRAPLAKLRKEGRF